MESDGRISPHNLFNFNVLQEYSFLLLQHNKQNSRANLQEWAAVSTAFSTEAGISSLKEEDLQGWPQVSKNRGFTRLYSAVSRSKSKPRRSDRPRTAQEPDWKHEDGTEKTENSMNGDSHKAERQRQQPDDWIQHESKQRERPAQDKQDDPQEESSHGNLVCDGRKAVRADDDRRAAVSILCYERERGNVSSTTYSLSRRRLAMDAGTSASSRMCESSISEWRTRPSA